MARGAGRELEGQERPETALAVLRAVLDSVAGLTSYWDTALHNVTANAAFSAFFSVDPDELTGRHIREVIGEECYAVERAYFERALAGERPSFLRRHVDVTGRERQMHVECVPHRSDGDVVGIVLLCTDVTERLTAEGAVARSIDQYRALARNLPGGFVLLFDHDLRFLVAEGRDLPYFGFTPDELEGQTLRELLPREIAAEQAPRYLRALSGTEVTWEEEMHRRVYSLTAVPVHAADGSVFAGMVVARDVTAERRSQLVLAALRDIATRVARHPDAPEDIAQRIAGHLAAIFSVATAGIIRYTGETTGELLAAAPRPATLAPPVLDLARDRSSAAARVRVTGRPALVCYEWPEDLDRDPFGAALRTRGYRIGAAAPIRHRGQLWGSISIADSDPSRISDELLPELAAFAGLLELALDNLEAWGELSAQATTDALTGLPNRRRFDDELRVELDRAARTGRPLSVIVADIDHFKVVNDLHGHLTGDRVLIAVATALAGCTRTSEVVARVGGEEFGWILPDTTADQALAAAERARTAIGLLDVAGVGRLAVSLGVCCSSDVDEPRDTYRHADEALYIAKRRGRNRSVRHPAG